MIPLAGFLVLAGFASLALLATLRGERDMTQLPSAMVGKPAPAVALPDLRDAGGTVSAIDFKGRPFLVNVFASWCAPCRAEAPALALLSEEIEIFGIAYKDKPEDTRASSPPMATRLKESESTATATPACAGASTACRRPFW